MKPEEQTVLLILATKTRRIVLKCLGLILMNFMLQNILWQVVYITNLTKIFMLTGVKFLTSVLLT